MNKHAKTYLHWQNYLLWTKIGVVTIILYGQFVEFSRILATFK